MVAFAAVAPIIGGALGGLFGSRGASDAAAAQQAAAMQQLQFSRETRDQVFDRLDPYYQAGIPAINALSFALGLGDAPTIGGTAPDVQSVVEQTRGTRFENPTWARWRGLDTDDRRGMREPQRFLTTGGERTQYRVGDQTFATLAEAQEYAQANPEGGTPFEMPVKAPYDLTLEDFEASPGYNFRLDEALRATEGAAASRHGLNSGATLDALNRRAQDVASAEYGNFYNRRANEYSNYLNALSGVASGGQNAATAGGNAAIQTNQQMQNALANFGNAGAAGAIGGANAWTGAINNALGGWQYNQLLAGVTPGLPTQVAGSTGIPSTPPVLRPF